jgi:hypothetical protein
MKNFITSMLGALLALVIFTTGAVLLFIGLIGAIVAMGQQKKAPEVADGLVPRLRPVLQHHRRAPPSTWAT